jgi:hypothetical protein
MADLCISTVQQGQTYVFAAPLWGQERLRLETEQGKKAQPCFLPPSSLTQNLASVLFQTPNFLFTFYIIKHFYIASDNIKNCNSIYSGSITTAY